MGKLTEILRQQGTLSEIQAAWNSTAAAGDFDVIPKGEYVADVTQGEAIESRTNATPGYRLTFEIVDGPHKGYRLWHECWFTPKAISRSKRDLAKLGVTSLEQLEQPLPAKFRCKVKVSLRKDDDGEERNRIRQFNVVEIIPHQRDDFAPPEDSFDDGEADQ